MAVKITALLREVDRVALAVSFWPLMPRRLTTWGMLWALSVVGCGGGDTAAPQDAAIDMAIDPDGGPNPPLDGPEGETSISRCPGEPEVHGGPMARVRWENGIAFCIDSTEVTNLAYAEFLAATVSADTQRPRCGWNKAFAPETTSTNGPACPPFDPATRPNHPVVCVDWCDADAYCRWAGKHLCQAPGGEPVKVVTAKDASEWVIACTGDGVGKYPYGDTAVPGRCVDGQFPAVTPALQPVKQAATCEGGVPGLFDMTGNAWEWNDDCVEKMGPTGQGGASGQGGAGGSGNAGGDDACAPLGGSYSTATAGATCTDTAVFLRKQVAGDTGFRCCVNADFF